MSDASINESLPSAADGLDPARSGRAGRSVYGVDARRALTMAVAAALSAGFAAGRLAGGRRG
ncbi:hypothetical protein [Ancylobacter lacus]|uniref:hypothetical protein n=1 Tax=Ancylobacter lacus TaxID=2579970 RepID=UPI001BCE7615|nr:hypothetical protein [Ancylobacter lacus]MBS7538250.1 hypothetical protein [Ancylobacter lacus]